MKNFLSLNTNYNINSILGNDYDNIIVKFRIKNKK
jgi:hypothetical protein